MAERIVADQSAISKHVAQQSRPIGPGLEVSRNQVFYMLNKLAELASVIEGLAAQQINDGGADFTEDTAVAIRELAAQAGFVADACCMKLTGGYGLRGDAEAWLLPPAFHDKPSEVQHD